MTSIFPLGDPPPEALAAYWQAIDDGCFRVAAACFSRDALYAAPLSGEDETAPRTVTTGSATLLERFVDERRAPGRHTALLCLTDGRDTLVEGLVRDLANEPVSTYVCSVRTAADGCVPHKACSRHVMIAR